MLNAETEPVFWILDMRHLKVDLNLLMQGAAVIARNPASIYRHPKVREVIFVFSEISDALRLAAQRLDSEIYGYIKTNVQPSVDDAIAYARSKI